MAKKRIQNNEIEERIAELFLKLRKRGLNQVTLSVKLGISQGHLSKLMSGKHQPSAALWLELNKLVGSRGEF